MTYCMFRNTFTFAVAFLLISTGIFAQTILDNNSPSVKWMQINTSDFQVIFPQGFESEAQRVANTLQTIHEPEAMGDKSPRKVSIVLRNRHAISNGFVTLGPRRSEFYTMPSQNNQFLGTNDWLDLLSVHEYRHIAQFQNSRTGITKWLSYLFGQNTQAGVAFAAAPRWFWEGDATTIETLNTQSGRGRIPAFGRVFKTNLLEKKAYNYNKQSLRSFRDFIPDHYKLGYYFVTHLRRRTDDADIWDKVSARAFAHPYMPFTFSNALKKHTGHYLVDNYDQMMADLKNKWEEQLEGLEPTTFEQVTRRSTEDFVDYSFPQVLEDGSIVALKSGIGDVEQLVKLSPEGEEIDKFVTGIMNNTAMLSSSQNKVVWNEFHFDARWRAKSYSVIKMYDFYTGEEKTLTKKSRYAGAAISPDGYKVATSQTTVSGANYLVVIDTYSGKELKSFKDETNGFYSMPRWSEDGSQIVVLKTTNKGRGLYLINYETGEQEELIAPGHENIGHPVLHEGYVLYNSPYNGIDNIYAFDLFSKDKYQVTRSKYGAYNAVVKDNKMVYNEHTANGLDVVKAEYDPSKWKLIEEVEDRSLNYHEPLIEQEGHADILSKVPNTKYPVKKYSKAGHMLNVHSWGPYATSDINRIDVGVFSRDVLSTTTVNLGYTYDINEETGFASANLSYQGFYPIIDVGVEAGERTSDGSFRVSEDSIGSVDFKWKETTIDFGLRIPWLFTKSKYHTSLTVGNEVRITKVSSFENSIDDNGRIISVTDSTGVIFRDELDNGALINNVFSTTFSRLHKTSKRDIYPQWGQYARLEHWSSPYGGDFSSGLFAFRSRVFFPSPFQVIHKDVFKHHSLNFTYDYQHLKYELNLDSYLLRNRIGRPRGMSFPTDEDFQYIATNYTFPLVYPDIVLGPVFNLQRIKCNLFYDYGYGKLDLTPDANFIRTATYQSLGAEVTFDFNVMRFSPLFEMGVRYAYNLSSPFEPAGHNVEFILGNISF